MPRRKTAICKCGRTVECTTGIDYEFKEYDLCWDTCFIYYVSCTCGIKTPEELTANGAWTKWKRLQENNSAPL
jgi:hypothetical protein